MLLPEEIKNITNKAIEIRKNAFSFKSGHSFGACVLTTDGEYFEGVNVEGVISSLGVCAEMAALDHGVVHGKYSFKAICTADDNLTYPCGACLQYLAQFSQVNDMDIEIVAVDMSGNYEIKQLSELLPKKFISKSFDEKIKNFNK
jgi:cytidine deaminase